MCLAHLGMAFCVAGAGLTSVYSVERDVRLAPGDSVELAGYTFAFMATRHAEGPNFSTEIGDFSVEREGRTLELHAEKRNYHSQMGNMMTEAAIDAGFLRDLYISLGEPLGGGAWAVRVHVKPFVRWLWLGGVLMGAGGALTLADRRYRQRRRPAAGGLSRAPGTHVPATDRLCGTCRLAVAWPGAGSEPYAFGAGKPSFSGLCGIHARWRRGTPCRPARAGRAGQRVGHLVPVVCCRTRVPERPGARWRGDLRHRLQGRHRRGARLDHCARQSVPA
jgi:hypothetical protein